MFQNLSTCMTRCLCWSPNLTVVRCFATSWFHFDFVWFYLILVKSFYANLSAWLIGKWLLLVKKRRNFTFEPKVFELWVWCEVLVKHKRESQKRESQSSSKTLFLSIQSICRWLLQICCLFFKICRKKKQQQTFKFRRGFLRGNPLAAFRATVMFAVLHIHTNSYILLINVQALVIQLVNHSFWLSIGLSIGFSIGFSLLLSHWT